MPDIGVRELKTRTSEIVRNVWKRRFRYTITYRGRPVGLLLPLERAPGPEAEASLASSHDTWAELTRLGTSIAARWPAEESSGAVLSQMRR